MVGIKVSTQNLCDELLERRYGEVVVDEKLRRQFHRCLNIMVFKVSGLRFSHDENHHCMSIELPAEFFDRPDFLWKGKPSDTKIGKFYDILKNILREFDNFYVDSFVKPSSTNLRLKLNFHLAGFVEGEKHIEDTLIKDLFVHLEDLWSKLRYKLKIYKWDML